MLHSAARPRFPGTLNLILLAITAGGIFAPQSLGLRAEEEDPSPTFRILPTTRIPAPDGTGKNRTLIGIGETVYLKVSGKSLGDPGKMVWTPTEGGQYLKTESRAEGVLATLIIRPTRIPKNQRLTISVQPENGTPKSITFTIVSPESIASENTGIPVFLFEKGLIGASAYLKLRIMPLSVSFSALGIVEKDEGSATDVVPQNDGFFLGKKHFPSPEGVPISVDNYIQEPNSVMMAYDKVGYTVSTTKTNSEKYLQKYGHARQSCYFLCRFYWYSSEISIGDVPFVNTKQQIIIESDAGFTQVTKFDSCVTRATETNISYYSK